MYIVLIALQKELAPNVGLEPTTFRLLLEFEETQFKSLTLYRLS